LKPLLLGCGLLLLGRLLLGRLLLHGLLLGRLLLGLLLGRLLLGLLLLLGLAGWRGGVSRSAQAERRPGVRSWQNKRDRRAELA
jgi:hypothetical protein